MLPGRNEVVVAKMPRPPASCRGILFLLALCVAAISSSAGFVGSAGAQEPSGLQAAIVLEQLVVQAIERSEKSVVSIARFNSETAAAARDFRPDIFPRPGLVMIDPSAADNPTNPDFVPNAFATGVVVDKAGFIVTNFHAVDGVGEFWVTTSAKRPLRAEIVGADRRSDLAVLKVTGAHPDVTFEPIKYGDTSKLKKGQIVIALGNPYAIARDGQASASWGIIANLSRKTAINKEAEDNRDKKNTIHHFGTLIQTDAKLNLGTSGGALLNLQGEMIGLTTSQAAVAGFEQSAGYAIPADDLFQRVVDTLKQGKEVEYGLLGVSSTSLSSVERPGGVRGVRIDSVRGGSPADRAGIYPGDIVTHVSGKPINDVDALMLHIGKQPAGKPTTIVVERHGRVETKAVTLAKYEVRGKNIVTSPRPTWRGIRVDFPSVQPELDPQFNQGVRLAAPCVMALEVDPESKAWEAGMRRGMLITHVDNTAVENPDEFYAEVAKARDEVELRIAALPGQPPVVKIEP
ncbi:MAG: trypsin-like peptidase domain-containing protein [Planctomycetales bacterium]|nr:trypsin-like peptidase domain-containing protein [Planctomycetales bacterium]